MIAAKGPSRARRAVEAGLAILAASFVFDPACAANRAQAIFGVEPVSAMTRRVGDWVVGSNDSRGEPFVIVDKVASKVFVFDGDGRLRGASPALLGLAAGDDSVPGIGERKMSAIRPEERTTPAGRFAASMARSLHGDAILWVDYDAAIALHRVATGVPRERRLQRLAGDAPKDRRITYGCINVPAKFFDDVVMSAFAGSKGVVYVLPETRSLIEVFGSYGCRPPKYEPTLIIVDLSNSYSCTPRGPVGAALQIFGFWSVTLTLSDRRFPMRAATPDPRT